MSDRDAQQLFLSLKQFVDNLIIQKDKLTFGLDRVVSQKAKRHIKWIPVTVMKCLGENVFLNERSQIILLGYASKQMHLGYFTISIKIRGKIKKTYQNIFASEWFLPVLMCI